MPNTNWDKPGLLTRDERISVGAHSLVTDQLLRRIPYTAEFAPMAASAHERIDGSGYHRRINGSQLDRAQRVIAAANCYQAMVSDRPHRRALNRQQAADELRTMALDGRLDREEVRDCWPPRDTATRAANSPRRFGR